MDTQTVILAVLLGLGIAIQIFLVVSCNWRRDRQVNSARQEMAKLIEKEAEKSLTTWRAK